MAVFLLGFDPTTIVACRKQRDTKLIPKLTLLLFRVGAWGGVGWGGMGASFKGKGLHIHGVVKSVDIVMGRAGWTVPLTPGNDHPDLFIQGMVLHFREMFRFTLQPELTANHLGWIEFRLCARNSKEERKLTHECLEEHLLENVKGETRFWVGSTKGFINFKIQLPKGVVGDYCTIQWKYNTGKRLS